MDTERGTAPSSPAADKVVAPAARAQSPTPESPDTATEAVPDTTAAGPTSSQRGVIHALYRGRGMDRVAYLNDAAEFVGRPITTTEELTKAEASALIGHLKSTNVWPEE